MYLELREDKLNNSWKLYLTHNKLDKDGFKKLIKVTEFKDCMDLKDAQKTKQNNG
ncbi:hypothetical protein [Clostridium sulfidigenes]|uniref:hypothetical protein n=1 Tax=Clostridium sulfidigenes TaxID=318464 RepID=UPI003F8ACF7E